MCMVLEFIFNSFYRILLSFGADVDLKDNKGYTPLFYASSKGSLSNLLELLDFGHADVNHISSDKNQNTAVSKAYSHEIIRILLKYGAEPTWFDFEKILQSHTEISTRAILSRSLFTINNEDSDLLVLDFSHFDSEEEGEKCDLALHQKVTKQKKDKKHLLLHPVLQSFLELKWSQIRKHYMSHLFLNAIFAILLSCTGYYFLDLIYCMSCDESINHHEGCTMPIVNPKGHIQCFGLKSKNDSLNEFKEGVHWEESCLKGGESCALITHPNETKVMTNLSELDPSHPLKCHKNFLR